MIQRLTHKDSLFICHLFFSLIPSHLLSLSSADSALGSSKDDRTLKHDSQMENAHEDEGLERKSQWTAWAVQRWSMWGQEALQHTHTHTHTC